MKPIFRTFHVGNLISGSTFILELESSTSYLSLIPNLIAQDGNAECASLQVGWGSHQDSVGRTAIYSVGNSIYGAMQLVGDVFKSFLDEKWGLVPS